MFVLFIRSPDCFQLGWPMDQNHDFFYVPSPDDPKSKKTKGKDKPKTDERNENNDEEAQVTLMFSIRMKEFWVLFNHKRIKPI